MSRTKVFYGTEADWEKCEEQVEFEVEKIVGERKSRYKIQNRYGKEYLVKWKGYPALVELYYNMVFLNVRYYILLIIKVI